MRDRSTWLNHRIRKEALRRVEKLIHTTPITLPPSPVERERDLLYGRRGKWVPNFTMDATASMPQHQANSCSLRCFPMGSHKPRLPDHPIACWLQQLQGILQPQAASLALGFQWAPENLGTYLTKMPVSSSDPRQLLWHQDPGRLSGTQAPGSPQHLLTSVAPGFSHSSWLPESPH